MSGKPAGCSVYVAPDPGWDGEGIEAGEASEQPTTPTAGGGPAEAAFKTWVDQFNAKDWAGQYDTLVSAQRALVSKGDYVACRSRDAAPDFKW